MYRNNQRGNYGGQSVGNFGGLSFANNKFEFADPVYDDLHDLSLQRADRWSKNKAGAEQMSDFINAQSVLDKDKGIKDGAMNNFTGAIKPFVDSGRYEEASFALTDAVRQFQNNKGFTLATGNYKAFSEWSQKQREQEGWSDTQKNLFIQGHMDDYQGVQVHEDGTVSGSFNGSEMGKFVNIQEKLAPGLKNFDSTTVDKVMSWVAMGNWKDNLIQDKTTTEYKDAQAVMAYVKNYIENDGEIQHFLQTRSKINSYSPPAMVANQAVNAMANSRADQAKFERYYEDLKKNNTAAGRKAQQAFREEYGQRDVNGNLVKDAKTGEVQMDHFLYTFKQHMIGSGALDANEAALPAGQLYKSFNQIVEEGSKVNASKSQIRDIMQKLNSGVPLLPSEQVILKADKYKEGLNNIDRSLYVAEQSYSAWLPLSGTKQTVSNLHTIHDDSIGWGIGQAAKQKESELALFTAKTIVDEPSMFRSLDQDGTTKFQDQINQFEQGAKTNAGTVKNFLKQFNDAIAAHNLSAEPKDRIAPIPPVYSDSPSGFADLVRTSAAQMEFIKKNQPSNYKQFVSAAGEMQKNLDAYGMRNGLWQQALANAKNIDKDYPTDAKLKKDYATYLTIHDSDNLSIKAAKTFEEFKTDKLNDYTENSEAIKDYIKGHIASGLLTDEVYFEGVRQSKNSDATTNYAKSTLANIDAYGKQLVFAKNAKYRAYVGEDHSADNTGGDVVIPGVSFDKKIANMKYISVYQNPSTGAKVYKYAITDDSKDQNVESPIGYIEFDDNDQQLNELTYALTKSDVLDAESKQTFNNMETTAAYADKINYTDARKNLTDTGVTAIYFNNGGNVENAGTLQLDYAREIGAADSDKSGSKTTKEFNTYIYNYNVGNERRQKQFNTFTEAAAFINTLYNDAYPSQYNR